MKVFKKIFWAIWRIWFYVVMLFILIVLSPLMVISILSEKWYPFFFKLTRIWARGVLFCMGFYYKIEREQKLDPNKSYMLVANHTSMTDIMLMIVSVKNPFVFVGKKSLAKIPLFGFFYKRTSILVDRSSSKSRMAVFNLAQKRLDRGLSICIFAEGGVPRDESILLDSFKDGAFRLAIEHQIPIVPITFPDNKKRFSYTFYSGSPGLMRVKIHKFISTDAKSIASKKDIKEIKDKTREVIYNQLLEYNK